MPICPLSSTYPAVWPWLHAHSHSFIQKIFAELHLLATCHTLCQGLGTQTKIRQTRPLSLYNPTGK